MVRPRTLYEQFIRTAEMWPNRPFCWYEGETVTYDEAVMAVDKRAGFLHETGVGKGDRVGLLCPNDPEFLYLLFATHRLGATFVPFNYRQEGTVLEYLLTDADVTTLVVDGDVLETFLELPDVTGMSPYFHDGPADERDYDAAVGEADSSHLPPVANVDPTKDVAILSYTSGTTGPPKGVENPHYNYVDAGYRMATACATDETDRALLVLPLFHANPTTYGLMQMLAVGGSVALVRQFSASRFFETARTSDSTYFTHVGSVLEILHRTLNTDDIDPVSSLRFAVGGAAQFERQREFEERTGVQLVRLYGLSEVGGGMVTITGYDPETVHGQSHQGSVTDQPFDVRILADDGYSFAGEGERGEILIRPARPGLMFGGYRGKPDMAVQVLRDLWFHTGDVGEFRDGNLHYVGRNKTNIRRMGENVSPWEIESALAEWDRVANVVAVGVSDDVVGEEIGLWVVPADDDLTEIQVYEQCRDHLAPHLLPRYVGFLNHIPRTSTHKIERAKLRERPLDEMREVRTAADESR